MTRSGRGHGTVILGVLLAGSIALTLSGCAAVKVGLGPRDQACFSSIPAAKAVVGPHAQFAGVRYVSPADLLQAVRHPHHQRLVPPDALADLGRRGACLIGYKGAFPARATSHAWRPLAGPYRFLVVVVRQSDHHVIGEILLPTTFIRFTHLF